MRFFILPSLMLGTLFLTSCSSDRTLLTVPHKAFQYSYQNPSRVLTTPEFSKHLSSGQVNTTVNTKLQNNQRARITLEKHYFSASGHACRKYKVQSRFEYSACNINGRWYEASPIIISNK